ncbi:MAG: hypothetical protein ND866_16625 [Pyrinomonadaceae bacterium]|nr:hypothetical protein [Pyrinomonadaceae bacterium]
MSDKEVRLFPERHEGSAQRARQASPNVVEDVRSTVESQFRQMEQVHDRIRAEELATRLAEHTID